MSVSNLMMCMFFTPQMKKLLWKTAGGCRDPAGCRDSPTPIIRKIDNEVDYQDGVVRVSARQFHADLFPLVIGDTTTAGDVILR